ncbi:MAG: serine/threonine protein kinase [Verrucomicrobiae bacterium]|nr:serine/threonine protein kinase [Verrucomicrobiae bacterium]
MSTEPDPLIGTVLRSYRLTRLIGRGAMGMVYAAEHEDSGLRVAVKFLSGEYSSKKEFVARFMHEAEACSAMQHENLMRVFEAGEHDGVYFMVMEYVDGIDLAYFLETQERVKESQALPWLKQTCRALAHAHAYGIVHRDLKPENIMLTRDGVVKLADLGLSKRLDADENLSMTLSGTVIGTPYYISPEQTKDAKRVDARTDIYSLGATFYHLLTGRPPFNGHSAAEVMAKHMNEPLTPPQRHNPALSDHLGDLLHKMMEKDPDKRFPSMVEVLEALDRVERGEAPVARTVRLRRDTIPGWSEVASSKPQRTRRGWTLLAGGAAALIALALFAAWFLKGNDGRRDLAPSSFEATAATSPPSSATPEAPPSAERNSPVPVSVPATTQEGPPSIESPPSSASASTKAYEEEEEVHLGGAAAVPERVSLRASFRPIDALGALILALGVIVTSRHGFRASCIRAVVVWLAFGLAAAGTSPLAAWLAKVLVVSPGEISTVAFLILSAATLLAAWTATRSFSKKERKHWSAAVGRFLAVVPSAAVGMAFAFWAFALMGFLAAADLGVADSWIGSRVISCFPALEKTVDIQLKAKH